MNKEFQATITKARVLGAGDLAVYLEDSALLGLIRIIVEDLKAEKLIADFGLKSSVKGGGDLFRIPIDEVMGSAKCEPEKILWELQKKFPDILTYFRCLCEIHKRRVKFQKIRLTQNLPTMQQVVPRSLLEYGTAPADALASWLTWRKWLYDIDNRSAQETGYIFEPIIAAALGGISFSASKSPIKRKLDQKKGRQVDCLLKKVAYEIKMRITIAASGQGRFREELDFSEDCAFSGFKPVLLVLDPTPSTKLTELKRAFAKHGGTAFEGEAAWTHIMAKAGPIMSVFVEKYVKRPLLEVEKNAPNLLPLSIAPDRDGQFTVTVGKNQLIKRKVARGEGSDSEEKEEQE